jgi:hypothetical protein
MMRKLITSLTALMLLFTNIVDCFGMSIAFAQAAQTDDLRVVNTDEGGESSEVEAEPFIDLPDFTVPVPLRFLAGTVVTPEEIIKGISGIDLSGGNLSPVNLDDVNFHVPGNYNASVVLHLPLGVNQKIIIPIIIFDNVPPIIIGLPDITYDIGASVSEEQFLRDAHINVTDNASEPVMTRVDMSRVDFNTRGVYNATVWATDSSGNTSLPFIVVVTIDGLVLHATVPVEAGMPLTSHEILAKSGLDLAGIDLGAGLDLSQVKFDTPGDYDVTLEAKGPLGKIEIIITIHIVDTTPPVITGRPVIYKVGASVTPDQFLQDAHIVVHDNAAGADQIVPEVHLGSVDFTKAGIYRVVVTATDVNGNEGVPLFLYVTIEGEIIPTITSEIQVEAGNPMTSEEMIIASGLDLGSWHIESAFDLNDVKFDVAGNYTASTVAVNERQVAVARIIIKIKVHDTIPPIIYADFSLDYEAGTIVTQEQFLADAHVVVTDNASTPIEIKVDLTSINFNEKGYYSAFVIAKDASWNVDVRIVHVMIWAKQIVPVITGNRHVTYIQGVIPTEMEFMRDLHITVSHEGGENVEPQADLSHINFNRANLYVGIIEATDSRGQQAEKFFVIVHIVPVPDNLITANRDVTYEAGTKVDSMRLISDANIEVLALNSVEQMPVVTLDTVNFARVGVYPVEVMAISRAGDVLASMTINVHIFDEKPPMIFADQTVTYTIGDVVTREQFIIDAHVKVEDNSGETETTIDLSYINFERAGPYVAIINAQDNAGNKAEPFLVFVVIVDA